MKKSTQELLDLLSKSTDFDLYMQTNTAEFISESLPIILDKLLAQKHIAKSTCILNSGLDRTYAYQIFSGLKKPSRDKLLALCFGMQCSLDEVQTLLKHTGHPPLYPRTQRDCAIIYGFAHTLSIMQLNELLYELNETSLQ